MKQVLNFGEKELKILKAKDPILGAAIDRIGYLNREIETDLFKGIVSNIVGQQISMKAMNTIWNRMITKFKEITPATIMNNSLEELQSVGITMRKATYLKSIAETIASGNLDLEELHTLPDEEVIERLVSLKGIGRWTAEMLMIFSMGRLDILSYDDLAIRKGIMKLYQLSELDKKTFQIFKSRYAPYGTIASLYLWKISQEK